MHLLRHGQLMKKQLALINHESLDLQNMVIIQTARNNQKQGKHSALISGRRYWKKLGAVIYSQLVFHTKSCLIQQSIMRWLLIAQSFLIDKLRAILQLNRCLLGINLHSPNRLMFCVGNASIADQYLKVQLASMSALLRDV